ncbi:hypothetical protein SCP_1204010 [Sparassis crispa]|uniref:GTPase activating protein n=1 Tax=Sparassis crispa TaxID=139825 RepID=A0A401H168_9APHY|nr:hypothetical protein SCP_1204010 [Sparassis crispa]GBE88171.1 hypothetical protein SCP_1204010 [Sparassis crispa]
MSDEGYPSSSWENADGSESHHTHTHNVYSRSPLAQIQPLGVSADSLNFVPPTPTKSTSPPRSSVESPRRQSESRWREGALPATVEYLDNATADSATLVEASFDENVLRALCELDCGVPLLLDRIKQSMVSCREASVFFKKRALLEEEYGRNMQKLAKSTSEAYAANDGKAGSFVSAWHQTMKNHEVLAENRLRFAQRLNEMSEELATLAKEVDKNRKQTKELANRYERTLQDSEIATEKIKNKFDVTAEELERLLLQKEGESDREAVQGRSRGGAGGKRAIGKAVAKGGLLLKGRNPGNIQKQEDDVRARMSNTSDTYRKMVTETQTIRQEYFNFQLPRILRALKECVDEIDLGTQYHLSRYAFLYENIVLSDGTTLAPPDDTSSGLKSIIESIDNRSDFKTYMQNYAFAHGGANNRGPRRDGPREEGYLPPIPALSSHPPTAQANTSVHVADRGRPTFGVDLAEQMARDGEDLPPIMVKCCQAIEKYGLQSQGIYRIGGSVSKIAKLKERLDRDLDSVDLDAEEWSSDISNVTSVLKMWLRELPEPLLTYSLYKSFLDAARNENERLRHIRLHERVNDLPDPNYATLKYFMGHLHKVAQHESENAMSIQNLAIVFGPTLFGQSQTGTNGQMDSGPAMADAPIQNKAVETILEHYVDIFVDENETA